MLNIRMLIELSWIIGLIEILKWVNASCFFFSNMRIVFIVYWRLVLVTIPILKCLGLIS